MICDIDDGDPVCAGCAQDFLDRDAARGACCAIRLPGPGGQGDLRCGHCLREPPRFDATVALADYAPPVERMLVALRFGDRLPLAHAFGTLLARAAAPALARADAICPVPLAFKRQAERGFNQAQEIARRLATACGRPLRTDILLRTRHTAAQMDLSLAERRRNVRVAFVARGDLTAMNVAVVDCVMTTGATLDEIAAAEARRRCDGDEPRGRANALSAALAASG